MVLAGAGHHVFAYVVVKPDADFDLAQIDRSRIHYLRKHGAPSVWHGWRDAECPILVMIAFFGEEFQVAFPAQMI